MQPLPWKMISSKSKKIGGRRPRLNPGGIQIPSQLLISSLSPSTGPEGMLHLVALQVEAMISFAVVAVGEGT
jgi:hypothetical protein